MSGAVYPVRVITCAAFQKTSPPSFSFATSSSLCIHAWLCCKFSFDSLSRLHLNKQLICWCTGCNWHGFECIKSYSPKYLDILHLRLTATCATFTTCRSCLEICSLLDAWFRPDCTFVRQKWLAPLSRAGCASAALHFLHSL